MAKKQPILSEVTEVTNTVATHWGCGPKGGVLQMLEGVEISLKQ